MFAYGVRGLGGGDRLAGDGQLRGEYLAGFRAPLKVCLAPGALCKNRVERRTHSIRNERVLEVLHRHDHVVVPEKPLDLPKTTDASAPYRRRFAEVGRNEATTFTGLCRDHDNFLFVPIENDNQLTFTSQQKFLLAYREVLRELHVSMRRAGCRETRWPANGRAHPTGKTPNALIGCGVGPKSTSEARRVQRFL